MASARMLFISMDMRRLGKFLMLALTRKFSQTSQVRHATQSTFSRRLRRRETRLGVSLYDRCTYPLMLTINRRAFRSTAESIVTSLYADRAQSQKRQVGQRPDLQIAAAVKLTLKSISDWLRRLAPAAGHPSTQINTRHFHGMAQNFTAGEIDMALQTTVPKCRYLHESRRPCVRKIRTDFESLDDVMTTKKG